MAALTRTKRLTLFFLQFLFISQAIIGQSLLETKPAFVLQSANLPEAIKHLEQQNQINISYNSSNFDLTRRITFDSKFRSLAELLDQIFDYQTKYLETRNRKILVTKILREQTISGIIRDAASGEKLSSVLVYIPTDKSAQVHTNNQGYFTLTTNKTDSVEVVAEYLGFADKRIKLRYPQSQLSIELVNDLFIPDIIITDHQSDAPSGTALPIFISDASAFPSLLGEKDIINSLKKYPQVNSGSEAQNGLIVRGGNTDQNLILLDGVPIYEVSHLGGLSSIIVNDEIRSSDFYASGFPARYGGRLSSVVDINLKEGNNKLLEGNLQASLLGLKGNFQGPLLDSTTTFCVSGRQSWFDTYFSPIISEQTALDDASLKYFDVHTKITHYFSPSNKVSFSAYKGRDEIKIFQNQDDENALAFESINELNWGNEILNFQWHFSLGSKFFVKNQLYRNKYDLLSRGQNTYEGFNDNEEIELLEFDAITSTKILDYNISSAIEYYHSNQLKLNFGFGFIKHYYEPNIVQSRLILSDAIIEETLNTGRLLAEESYIFFQSENKINDRLQIDWGVRANYFRNQTNYLGIQPRININYKYSELVNLRLSASRMQQNVHLLVNPGTGLPSQLWVPSSEVIKPEYSDEVSIGIRLNPSKYLDVQVGGYFKQVNNLIDFEASLDLFAQVVNDFIIVPPFSPGQDWESKVILGEGRYMGIETMINYVSEKSKFWASYTYGKAEIRFPNIRDNRFFPAENDFRHDIDIGSNIRIYKELSLSAHWVYNQGRRFTLSYETRPGPGNIDILLNPLRNDNIFPAFHHLDLNLLYKTKINDHNLIVSLGVYNVYNRANPYYFYLFREKDQSLTPKELSLFPRLPQLSLEYAF